MRQFASALAPAFFALAFFHSRIAHQRFHHLLRLGKLLEQSIDISNRGATSPSNALAAAAVDNVMRAPLFQGH